MRIEAVYLRNWRNYPFLELKTCGNVNSFVGANAQGKTNLLEALSFLSTGKTFRAKNEREAVRWGEKECSVAGLVTWRQDTLRLKITFNAAEGKKQFFVNGVSVPRAAYIGKFIPVLFTPDDLTLVKGSPQNRRRYLDEQLFKISYIFEADVSRYYQILRQRNTLLKQYGKRVLSSEEMAGWNEQFCRQAAKITAKRMETLHKLSLLARLVHRRLTDRDENLELSYVHPLQVSEKPSREEIEHSLLQAVEEKKEQEARFGQTLVGPHRDDIQLLINGKDARIFASQGQQRTLVLALKLAEAELLKGETGENPVLLFDDVFSELDEKRRELLTGTVQKNMQTFITGTEAEHLWKVKEEGAVYRVEEGKVRPFAADF